MSAPTDLRCAVCGRTATSTDRFCGFCGSRLDGEAETPPTDGSSARPHSDRILIALRAATLGEYDIAGEIGRGGMAVVFLAHDLSLNRKVAIKALLPELLYTEGMDRRFKHEARIAAKLDHPNILVIHGVREANDLLYIVMKLVDGLPLSTIAKLGGPLPIPVVRTVVRSVADALAYAHGEGVIHRDVKPANIMVDRRGNVVVMDFGIAKAADDAHLTRTGLVIGTPAYMSPEQCLAQPVTSASDQYSLGVVAYELLTGRTPFRGSALEMQWSHATAAPPPARSLRADCPLELEAIILRMMAKAASERFPSLHEVSLALADDPTTVNAARATLVSFVNELPGRRDPTLPTTPASPVPIGPGPAVLGTASTGPVRGSTTGAALSRAPHADTTVAPLLTLSKPRIELATGDSVELVVEFQPSDIVVDRAALEWSSSDPAVANVSSDGIVTAVGPGLADVTCVWEQRRAACQVYVRAVEALAPLPTPVDETPASPPTTGSASRRRAYRWTVVAAAAVLGLVIYRATRPDMFVGPLPDDIATSPATPAAPTPPTAVPAPPQPNENAPPASEALPAPTPAGGTGRGTTRPDSAAGRGLTSSTAGSRDSTAPDKPPTSASGATQSSPTKSVGAAPENSSAKPADARGQQEPDRTGGRSAAVVPTVPPPGVSATRLTNRADTAAGSPGAGYLKNAAAGSTATAPSALPRESTTTVIPPAPPEVASGLFREFANAISAQSFSRVTAAFPQPSDAAAAKVWADFLIFVRDYKPRAVVRSTVVNTSSSPATIRASIEFRWSGDAGYDRVRATTFTGYGVPISGGWQLRGVRMDKRFW